MYTVLKLRKATFFAVPLQFCCSFRCVPYHIIKVENTVKTEAIAQMSNGFCFYNLFSSLLCFNIHLFSFDNVLAQLFVFKFCGFGSVRRLLSLVSVPYIISCILEFKEFSTYKHIAISLSCLCK